MKREEHYRGVILIYDYDRSTGTYIGSLAGSFFTAHLQAATYEGLIKAFYEAVDAPSQVSGRVSLALVPHEAGKTSKGSAVAERQLQGAEDDLFSRRKFLR